MNEKTLRMRHAYYLEEIIRLGKMPLNQDITIKALQLSDTIIKTGYRHLKELKKSGLKCTIIEYIHYVSLLYFMSNYDLDARWLTVENFDSRNTIRISIKRPDIFFHGVTELKLVKDLKDMEKATKTLSMFFDFYVTEVANEWGKFLVASE